MDAPADTGPRGRRAFPGQPGPGAPQAAALDRGTRRLPVDTGILM